MKYSREELNEAYKRLPPELQDVFLSTDVTDSISSIGKKYNLHIDQIGGLDSETGLVLLGLTHPTEFVSNVTKRLGIDRVIASQVASDINDQIFLKVRELLKDVKRVSEDTTSSGRSDLPTDEPLHPSRDALMAALEHPEGMLKRASKSRGEIFGDTTPIPLVPVAVPEDSTLRRLNLQEPPASGRSDLPVAEDSLNLQKPDLQAPPVPSRIERPVPTAEVFEDSTLRRLNLQKPDILTQKMSGQFNMPKVETRVEITSATSAKKIDPYKEQI